MLILFRSSIQGPAHIVQGQGQANIGKPKWHSSSTPFEKKDYSVLSMQQHKHIGNSFVILKITKSFDQKKINFLLDYCRIIHGSWIYLYDHNMSYSGVYNKLYSSYSWYSHYEQHEWLCEHTVCSNFEYLSHSNAKAIF